MHVFRCKMCGGSIEVNVGSSVGTCDSCGTQQTLPRLDDERRANLYDRANHFRRNNDFDKASGIYEQILSEDNTDAEAYWSLVLCRYGVEYVEDPATHKRVPTVNRTQFTSIFDDDNYKSALEYADGYQRSLYEKEANAINEIQKGILAISQKEEPFDVFICYKETDHNGRRTTDSVLANDLYHQLTQEGFKVFFSRITLEDKLGTAYEPYIFAALNSAKVMVVLGTKPEHINSVWVKNEWSRYLSLVKQSGGKKVLIPAYKDMDPYDLPDEFSHLQAQDMSKLGFMQDLVRGIKKIAERGESEPVGEEPVAANTGLPGIKPLLERVFIFLEDGNWEDADKYCEKVLDRDPKNAWAYLGKLMAEFHIHRKEDLTAYQKPFSNSSNYQKIIRFGGDKMKGIVRLNERNEKRIENEVHTSIYEKAFLSMQTARTETEYKSAAASFKSIPGFKDADSLAEECIVKAEACRRDSIYASALAQKSDGTVPGYERAIQTFEKIRGWKDTDEQIAVCERKIEEIRVNEKRRQDAIREEKRRIAARKEERKRVLREKIRRVIVPTCIAICSLLVVAIIFVAFSPLIIPKMKGSKAYSLLEAGDYNRAYALFEEIGDRESIASSKRDRAKKLLDSGNFDEAYRLFEEVGDNEVIRSSKRDRAKKLINSGDFDGAYKFFAEIGDRESIASSKRERAKELLDSGDFDGAYKLFTEIGDNGAVTSSKRERAKTLFDSGDFESAYALLNGINDKECIVLKEQILNAYPFVRYTSAQVGSYIAFGAYEQDYSGSRGKQKIEWLVLKKEKNRILVISRYALDCKPFNTSRSKVTWETCSLREWLNDVFFNAAFSPEERKFIQSTTLATDMKQKPNSTQDWMTVDKAFILSVEEANIYFSSDDSRKCAPTPYAVSKGVHSKSNGCCWCWLRSSGATDMQAAGVSSGGPVYTVGNDVDYHGGVRPAIWIGPPVIETFLM